MRAMKIMPIALLALCMCSLVACSGLSGDPYFSSKQKSIEVNGCEFEAIIYVYSIETSIPPIEHKYTAWSGSCQDGHMIGPGYLDVSMGKFKRREFSVFKPGKPRPYFITLSKLITHDGKNFVEGKDYAQYTKQFISSFRGLGSDDRFELPLTEAECLAIDDCKVVHDAYFATISDEQKNFANTSSAEMVAQHKRGIEEQRRHDAIAKAEIARINQEVDDERRAEKQRWRDERAAVEANTPGVTDELVTGLTAITAASGQKDTTNALVTGLTAVIAASDQNVAPISRSTSSVPAQPSVNDGNNTSAAGGHGIGKYKAPKVACDDHALGIEMDKHSATINEGRGICDNAKAAAKLYEFYANLLEASCPKKTAEVVQAREAVESAKETIRGSCADFNY